MRRELLPMNRIHVEYRPTQSRALFLIRQWSMFETALLTYPFDSNRSMFRLRRLRLFNLQTWRKNEKDYLTEIDSFAQFVVARVELRPRRRCPEAWPRR